MLESAPVSRSIRSGYSSITRRGPSQCINLRARSFTHQVRCLASPETQPPIPEGRVPKAADLAKYAAKLNTRSILKPITETYTAFGGTEKMFKECMRQADYTVPGRYKSPPEPAPKNEEGEDIGEGTGLWFAPRERGGLALPVTFTNWAQIMFLHMYIYTVCIRRMSADDARLWNQHFLDHFFQAAEDKMELLHGMAARGIRNKNLKDLWLQWRGVLLSYDEGLIRGDAMLGAAVWRGIFKADPKTSIADVALVTAYMRKEIQALDRRHGINPITAFEFHDFSSIRKDLQQESVWMTKPFSLEEMVQSE